MNRCVLDASAVLAYLHEEPGSEKVSQLLDYAAVSAVNVAEVASKLADDRFSDEQIREAIGGLRITVIELDEQIAYRIAALRRATSQVGLSLGDRACLATAQSLRLPAVTAERSWALLDAGVEIQVIR